MELYIGGCAQGKLDYVLAQKENRCKRVIHGEELFQITSDAASEEDLIVHDFHLWVREAIRRNMDAEQMCEALFERYPNLIMIADEIGNGIVPMDAFERDYRERLGRILIKAAKSADRVERIICGLGQRIK